MSQAGTRPKGVTLFVITPHEKTVRTRDVTASEGHLGAGRARMHDHELRKNVLAILFQVQSPTIVNSAVMIEVSLYTNYTHSISTLMQYSKYTLLIESIRREGSQLECNIPA